MKKYLPILVVLALAFIPLSASGQQQDGQPPQQQAQDGAQQGQESGQQAAQGGRQQAEVQAEITITQEQPQVTVRQQPPEITIIIPRPIVTITIPEPQVDIQMPEPRVSVRQPEPEVQVTMGELQVEPAQPGPTRQQPAQARVQIEQEEPRIRIQQEEPEVRITRTGRQQVEQGRQVEQDRRQAQGQPAQAARQPQQPPQQPQQETTIRLSRLRGTRVVDPQGRQAGVVQDAWLTAEGGVSHLVLELPQGIGGLQPGSYLAPPRALLMQGDRLALRQTQGLERLEGQGRPPQVARSSVPVSRLLEYRLIGRDGGQLGRIEDVVVDARQGRVSYAAVAFEGGQLGAGQRLVAVPYSDLRYDLGEGTVTLEVTRRQLEQAPADLGFTQGEWPASASPQWSRLRQQDPQQQAR